MRRPVCSGRWDPEWLSSGSPGGLGRRGNVLEVVPAGKAVGMGLYWMEKDSEGGWEWVGDGGG